MKKLFFTLTLAFASIAIFAQGYSIGDEATNFNLKSTSGEMVSLDSYPDAKGYIVIFTCNHCPFSVAYEDRIIDLHKKYAPRGYPVIAINPNDTPEYPTDSFEAMIERAEEKDFPFAYIFDKGQKIYPQYGATKTPHVFLLDRERKVQYIGAIDDSPRDPSGVSEEYVVEAITSLQLGEKPDPATTKAIGCSIKSNK